MIRLKIKGMRVQQIVKHLEYEGVEASSVSVYTLLKKYEMTKLIQDRKLRLHPQLLEERTLLVYR